MKDFQFTNSTIVAWRKSAIAEGVEVKDLGSANGRSMQLVKFACGTAFPQHIHPGPEFIYLLEGVAFQEGQQLDPGWAAVAASGSIDTKFWSPSGCTFLTIYSD